MRRILVLLAMVTVGLLVAGCNATGGGYIPSATDAEGTATFAFSGKCQNKKLPNGEVAANIKGQIQYYDHPADVKIHAEVTRITVITGSATPCEDQDDTDGDTDVLTGSYRVPGGPKEVAGDVRLEVTDGGEPGINGDQVTISLEGGPYNGYTNSGFVQGGNVQVH